MSVTSKVTPGCAVPDGCVATTLPGVSTRAPPASGGGSLVCAEALVAISNSSDAQISVGPEPQTAALRRPEDEERLEEGQAVSTSSVMPGCGAETRACLVRLEDALSVLAFEKGGRVFLSRTRRHRSITEHQ